MAGLETQAAASLENVLEASERHLHVMYAGVSHDISFAALDVGDASTDDAVKNAVASYFQIPIDKLRFFQLDRHENGNATLRPQAVFGCGQLWHG